MSSRTGRFKVGRPPHQAEEGGSIPTPVLFVIRGINHLTAKDWVETWHYSKRMPTGKNICYGLFAGGDLYAVIVYGIGVNPYQAKFLQSQSVLEIKRMCRREPKQDYQLSRLIRITAKMAQAEHPHDCIVAFADPAQGHEGTVYKAAGFTFHGMTGAEWHLEDASGEQRHRRLAFRHSRRNNISVAESRDALGLTRVMTPPQEAVDSSREDAGRNAIS